MGNDEDHIARTSKNIAYALLVSYAVALILIGIVAAFKPSGDGDAWLDLFKSGFLILGGGLTMVIGYYFGSRGTQAAEERGALALQEAQKANEEAERERVRVLELEELQAPTYEEASLGLEEPPANIDEEL
jgi:hypothetical protein